DLDRLLRAELLVERCDPVPVALAVAEAERVVRDEVVVPLGELAVVEQEPPPPVGVELVVVAALRAHLEGARELGGVVRVRAAVAATEHARSQRALLA